MTEDKCLMDRYGIYQQRNAFWGRGTDSWMFKLGQLSVQDQDNNVLSE